MKSGSEHIELSKLSPYPAGTRFQVLLGDASVLSMLDDWLSGGYGADVRVRRAKTRGMFVVETTDVVYASRLVLKNPGCRVNIIKN